MMLVDAHVHLHPCFSPERFLDAAADNMATAVAGLGLAASTPDVLLFTHSAGDDAFGGLRTGPVGRWSLAATQETISMSASRAGGAPLILVAGRQIVTAEGLEVLALGAPGPFVDGQPIETTIDTLQEHGGIPVIPWGFGKWWRRRGEIVRRIAADHARFPVLFLGDSAGRLGIAPRPAILAQAKSLRRVVLPGTDPLPIPGEMNKVGRLVFSADEPFDPDRPFAALKRWLLERKASPPTFGDYERVPVFIRRQIEIQLRKRLPITS